MKRILLSSTIILASLGLLSGCGYADAPAPQSKPSTITNLQTEDLYEGSQFDDNGLSHWVFTQKLPDGTTATCIAARSSSHNNVSISCLPPQEK